MGIGAEDVPVGSIVVRLPPLITDTIGCADDVTAAADVTDDSVGDAIFHQSIAQEKLGDGGD